MGKKEAEDEKGREKEEAGTLSRKGHQRPACADRSRGEERGELPRPPGARSASVP